MPTYLLFVVVSDLVPTRDMTNGIAMWTPNWRTNATEFTLSRAHPVRNTLSDYLGFQHQMNTLDMVPAVNDDVLLVEEPLSTTGERQNVLQVLAHGISHHWFGNLVTCQWWTDVWLHEGFATYLEAISAEKVTNNQWQLLDQFVLRTKIPTMRKDAERQNTKAMNQPVTTLQEISEIHDFVAYGKAASVLRMFHHLVGDTIWEATLRLFLRENQFKSVERTEFYRTLESVASTMNFPIPQGITLGGALENWANNFGLPMVSIDRDYTRARLNISQSRFMHSNLPVNHPSVNFYVPLKFANPRNHTVDDILGTVWLTPTSPSTVLEYIVHPDSWYLANPLAFGYYRVKYDSENWRRLTIALRETNSIPVSSRVQLIDDAMVLARFGWINYGIALDLISYIRTETDFAPIAIALDQLDDLTRNLRGVEVNVNGLNRDILDSLYRTMENSTTGHVQSLLEVEAKNFACRHGYERCLSESNALLDRYLQNTLSVDADLRWMIFCGAVQINETRFRDVFNLYSSLAPTEFQRVVNNRVIVDILSAFGCVRQESIIQELLTMSLRSDSNVFMTSADRFRIFSAIVSGSLQGTGHALNMLQNNWRSALEHFGTPATIFNALAPNVVTPEHVSQVSKSKFECIK